MKDYDILSHACDALEIRFSTENLVSLTNERIGAVVKSVAAGAMFAKLASDKNRDYNDGLITATEYYHGMVSIICQVQAKFGG